MNRIEKLLEYLQATPNDNFLRHALALEYIKVGNDNDADRRWAVSDRNIRWCHGCSFPVFHPSDLPGRVRLAFLREGELRRVAH